MSLSFRVGLLLSGFRPHASPCCLHPFFKAHDLVKRKQMDIKRHASCQMRTAPAFHST